MSDKTSTSKRSPRVIELAPDALDMSFEEPEEAVTEAKEVTPLVLPTALQRRSLSCYLFAGLLVLASVFCSIYFKQPRILVLILIAAYIAYLGIQTAIDYRKGEIIEAVLVCSSVSANAIKKNAKVIFRTDDDIPDYYSFTIPKRWSPSFVPNVVYLVYFNVKSPNLLLGYQQL